MEFEAVRVLRTLKCGQTVYQGGKIYREPFSPDILKELARGSPHIEPIYERREESVEEPQEAQQEENEILELNERPEKSSRLVRRSK